MYRIGKATEMTGIANNRCVLVVFCTNIVLNN